MKNRASSPIHVHVSDATPVHVHVTSQRSPTRTPQGYVKQDRGFLRPTATIQTRGPWITPEKGSLRDVSFKWEPTDPYLGESQSALQLNDLTSDEEERIHGQTSQNEKKNDKLKTAVISLKNEVELKKKEQMLERQSERLNISQKVIAEQEEELAVVTKELEQIEQENTRLRHSMKKMLAGTYHNRQLETQAYNEDKDFLLTKLMEADVNSKAAAKQASALRESVCKIGATSGGRLSVSSHLAHQKELLLQKLEIFENTNRSLRHLLREHHKFYMDSAQLSEQKDNLLKKLSDTEAENAMLVVKLQKKERQISDLCSALDDEKENVRSTSNLSKSLEATRANLQGQLRSKSADNSRLSIQIKNLERSVNDQKSEVECLTEQLTRLKQQSAADKEALKRAARAQKQRAERSEGAAGQLRLQLLEMEKRVTEALQAVETWENRHAEEVKEKNKLELELTVLNSHIADLSEQLRNTEDKGRADRDSLVHHLHGLTSESTAAKLENESLKANVSTLEEKLTLSQLELQQVKATIQQYESLVDSYKVQLGKTRSEADEYCARLAKAEQGALAVKKELDQEIEQVRRDLLGRLAELEPLPEALRHAELKLQEAQERERSKERHSNELSTTISDLRIKLESEDSQFELLKQKNKVLLEENRSLQHQIENIERKLEEANSQNSELLTVVAKWEDTIHSNQLRLEEKNRECTILNRKLEEALNDAQQQISGIMESVSNKERFAQSKILEFESQLSRTTSEIKQLRKSKEEAEWRYQSRLQDFKDRLEQSDSTNRSLQNYVQFLKASYANVFGETSHGSSNLTPLPL